MSFKNYLFYIVNLPFESQFRTIKYQIYYTKPLVDSTNVIFTFQAIAEHRSIDVAIVTWVVKRTCRSSVTYRTDDPGSDD